MKKLKKVLLGTIGSWYKQNALTEGAALSFYTTLALPALILSIASIASFFLDTQIIQEKLLQLSSFALGETAQDVLHSLLTTLPSSETVTLTTVIGILFLFITASGIFWQLQDALKRMWEIKTPKQGVGGFLKNQFFLISFILIFGIVFALTTILESVFASDNLALQEFLSLPFGTLHHLSFILNLVLLTIIFACLFQFLPKANKPWKEIWLGSIVATLFFTLGKFLFGIYFSLVSVGSAYGAAASVIALLVWIYYSSQSIFLGAAFTKHAHLLFEKK